MHFISKIMYVMRCNGYIEMKGLAGERKDRKKCRSREKKCHSEAKTTPTKEKIEEVSFERKQMPSVKRKPLSSISFGFR